MAAGRCYVWFIVSTHKGEVNSFQTVVTSVFAVIVNVEEANEYLGLYLLIKLNMGV